MFQNLTLEIVGGIAKITFIREKALNAFNEATLIELDECLDQVENDNSIRVLIFTGKGKAFVAGADIKEFKDKSPIDIKSFVLRGQKVFNRVEMLPIPTIAAINGFALGGGCELSMACDFRIASSNALFGQPEIKLGLIPGWGGTQRLSRLVGIPKAKELIFLGKNINAEEALKIGLVNEVTSPEELESRVQQLAEKLSKGPAFALRMAKEAINRGTQMELYNAIQMESNLFAMCFAHDDMKEGVNAFLEKRKPSFS